MAKLTSAQRFAAIHVGHLQESCLWQSDEQSSLSGATTSYIAEHCPTPAALGDPKFGDYKKK
jgi:hypothetical protein